MGGITPVSPTARFLQLTIAFTLTFVMGSTFSIGAFTVYVERAAVPPGALDGIWPATMGSVHFLSSPVMMLGGLLLGASPTHALTTTARRMSAVSALSFFLFALAGAGVASSSPSLILTGISLLAVPLGIYTVLAIELMTKSLPNSPGTAVGLLGVAFGLGSGFFAWVFDALAQAFPAPHAIFYSASILGTLTALPTFFLRFPPNPSLLSPSQAATEQAATQQEALPLLVESPSFVQLTWRLMIAIPSFWLYTAVVLTGGASYALIPYFFKLGYVFHQPTATVMYWFQASSIASVVFSLVASMLSDLCKTESGALSLGSRNIIFVMLTTQVAIFASLTVLTRPADFNLYASLVGALKMVQAAHPLLGILLARDMFGEVNSALVFGVGGGLALGWGEALSVALMAGVEGRSGGGANTLPLDYKLFYVLGAAWSAAALVSLVSMRRSDGWRRCGEQTAGEGVL